MVEEEGADLYDSDIGGFHCWAGIAIFQASNYCAVKQELLCTEFNVFPIYIMQPLSDLFNKIKQCPAKIGVFFLSIWCWSCVIN